MKDETGSDSAGARPQPVEKSYMLRRAEQHRRLAERASEPDARLVHLRLAALYEERADQIVLVDSD